MGAGMLFSVAVLLSVVLSCKPAPLVSAVFKASEETSPAPASPLAAECRPDPKVQGSQIEVCRQSATGIAPQ